MRILKSKNETKVKSIIIIYILAISIFIGCSPVQRDWAWLPFENEINNNTDTSNTSNNPPSTPPSTNSNFWGSTNGIPEAHNVLMYVFVNRTYGAFSDSQIFWAFNGITNSIAEAPYFDMPANAAGRMYFFLGSKNSQYVDFIEFTITTTTWYGNTTRVDWFGFPIALRLICKDGYDEAVGEDEEFFKMPRAQKFQLFKDSVPDEFKHLADVAYPYRIIAPQHSSRFQSGGVYQNYFTSYVDQVWSIHSLTIPKPNTVQVFGCSGPLATQPQIAAALNRHTAHLSQSQWQTISLFYQNSPANYYAKFFHDHSIQKKAYGFPYDDVAEQAAYMAHSNPRFLIIAIGY